LSCTPWSGSRAATVGWGRHGARGLWQSPAAWQGAAAAGGVRPNGAAPWPARATLAVTQAHGNGKRRRAARSRKRKPIQLALGSWGRKVPA
jgi:hypothetical protein